MGLNPLSSNDITKFDLVKHYNEIAIKYRSFIKDFDLEDYIDFKKQTGHNHCTQCHYQVDEPVQHRQAKNKLFEIMLNNSDYSVESELRAVKNKGHLQVFDVGERYYQLDVLAIHVRNLQILFDHVDKITPVSYEFLKGIEHNVIFILEADGGHSWKKDQLRDNFFFEEYGLITTRYEVTDLVDTFRKARSKYASKAHMKYYNKEVTEAYHTNLVLDDILGDVKAYYKKRYGRRYKYNN